jgi:hypothetical protein
LEAIVIGLAQKFVVTSLGVGVSDNGVHDVFLLDTCRS